MPRRSISIIGIVVFAAGAAYVLGGADMYRELRTRAKAFMEPPTPAQIQRAVAVEAQQARADSIARADTANHTQRSDPPASLGFILAVVGATLGGLFVLIVLSTRWAAVDRWPRSERNEMG
jgi:hypothetical protein